MAIPEQLKPLIDEVLPSEVDIKREPDAATIQSFKDFKKELLESNLAFLPPVAQDRALALFSKDWEDYNSPYIRILEPDESFGDFKSGRASFSRAEDPLVNPDTLNIYSNDLLQDYMAEFAHQMDYNPLGLTDSQTLLHRQNIIDTRTTFWNNTLEYAKDQGKKWSTLEIWEDIAYGKEILYDGEPTMVYSVFTRFQDTNELMVKKVPYYEMTEEDWELSDIAKQELWKTYHPEFYTHEILESKYWESYYNAIELLPKEQIQYITEKYNQVFKTLDSFNLIELNETIDNIQKDLGK